MIVTVLKQDLNSKFFQVLEALNTPQLKPDKHIFTFHRLTVLVVLSLEGLTPTFAHVLCCHIKLAFLLTFLCG